MVGVTEKMFPNRAREHLVGKEHQFIRMFTAMMR